MWSLTRDARYFAGLARHLRPEVLAFHVRYEAERAWARGRAWGRGPRAVRPSALYVETSTFCRGRCRGCYVPVRDRLRATTIAPQVLARAIAWAERERPEYVCLVGGEPLDPVALASNLEVVRGAPGVRFLVCTGCEGAHDVGLMRELAALPNLGVMFSVDGDAPTHDRLRGRGSHARTLRAMHDYNGRGGQICGASVTLRPESLAMVTSEAFYDALVDAGCNLVSVDAWYPGARGEPLSPAMLLDAVARLRRVARHERLALFVNPYGRLWADGFAARRGMLALAIDARGDVYASRRGEVLGNAGRDDLDAIVASEAFQRAGRTLALGGCAEADPRRALFERALAGVPLVS